ncbi:MAG: gamma-glutamyl-gamma-aminobutyrate hydrolase family protein [Rickettsiales bacterium]|nr:gamma-glutamyl-gamma-aminobutyrate hydrolase family protein [Rickettsiales bacterium]
MHFKRTVSKPNGRIVFSISAEQADEIIRGGGMPKIAPLGDASGKPVAILMQKFNENKDYGVPYSFHTLMMKLGIALFPIFFENVEKQLDECRPRGIILPGGAFTVPDKFRANPPDRPPVAPDDPMFARFNAYGAMIDYAARRGLPTLGVCAGMQMAGCIVAGLKIGPVPDGGVTHGSHDARGIRHAVDIIPGTMLSQIIGRAKISVNSRHRACLSGTPAGCRVAARAEDGVIETLEMDNPWNEFVLFAQWHPETMAAKQIDSPSGRIFRRFAAALGK